MTPSRGSQEPLRVETAVRIDSGAFGGAIRIVTDPRARNERVRRGTNQQNAAARTLTADAHESSKRSPAEGRAPGGTPVSTITVRDGSTIYYKDCGPSTAQPIVFHHGWPLSADDWDTQMLYFMDKGYRVIAHDRRGHGRSSQVSDGHDMDHYAADAAARSSLISICATPSTSATPEGHPEGLREVSTRHVHDARRRGQHRLARLHQGLSTERRSAKGDIHELGQDLTLR